MIAASPGTVPRKADQSMMADKLISSHKRSVRAYVDWRSGQLDVDLVMRIETIKGKAA